MKEKNCKFVYFLEFCLLLFLDLISKNIIRLSGGFYVCNNGIAWGIKLKYGLLLPIWLSISLFLFYYLYKALRQKHLLEIQALLLITAGMSGNFLSRFNLGCIIDFLKLPLFSFPLFNLADSFILIGCLILFIHMLQTKNSA